MGLTFQFNGPSCVTDVLATWVPTSTSAVWQDDHGDPSCREYAEGAGAMSLSEATRMHGHPASPS
jgi:hypothetical protein